MAFHKLRIKRDELQAEKDSKNSEVKLENLNREIQYEVNRNGNRLIEFYVSARLINNSIVNSGRLHSFELSIDTKYGFYLAKVERPLLNYLFEPSSIYPSTHFCFQARVYDSVEHLGIISWEPYIRGAKARIILEVSPQNLQTYEMSIASEGKVYE